MDKDISNLETQTAAIYGISIIANNFDAEIHVVERHSGRDASVDQEALARLIEDFSRVDPFCHTENRHYEKFPHMSMSRRRDVDWLKFLKWFYRHRKTIMA